MIDDPTHVATREQDASEHANRYETLRAYAVERHAQAARDGLVVLLHQGVAAWIDVWSRLPTPPPRPEQGELPPSPLAEDTSAEVVRVLASMALGHIQIPEVYA